MRDEKDKSQVAENNPNKVAIISLTQKGKKGTFLTVASKAKTQPKSVKTVRIIPTEEESAILEAGMRKHGLKKAVDVVRMALRRFAEAEEFHLKAS